MHMQSSIQRDESQSSNVKCLLRVKCNSSMHQAIMSNSFQPTNGDSALEIHVILNDLRYQTVNGSYAKLKISEAFFVL